MSFLFSVLRSTISFFSLATSPSSVAAADGCWSSAQEFDHELAAVVAFDEGADHHELPLLSAPLLLPYAESAAKEVVVVVAEAAGVPLLSAEAAAAALDLDLARAVGGASSEILLLSFFAGGSQRRVADRRVAAVSFADASSLLLDCRVGRVHRLVVLAVFDVYNWERDVGICNKVGIDRLNGPDRPKKLNFWAKKLSKFLLL